MQGPPGAAFRAGVDEDRARIAVLRQGVKLPVVLPHLGRVPVSTPVIARRIDIAVPDGNRIQPGFLLLIGRRVGVEHLAILPDPEHIHVFTHLLRTADIDIAVGNAARLGTGILLSVGQGIERPAVFPDNGDIRVVSVVLIARNVNIGVDRHGADARLAACGGRDGRMSGPDGRETPSELTIATASSLLDHVRALSAALSGVTVAVSCSVPSKASSSVGWLTSTPATPIGAGSSLSEHPANSTGGMAQKESVGEWGSWFS